MKTIPFSKFKRNLNSLLKHLNNHPDLIIMVTRNKKEIFVLTSIEHYEEIKL